MATFVSPESQLADHTRSRASTGAPTARLAAWTSFAGALLCVAGAVVLESSSADLFATMEASSSTEMAAGLGEVAADKTQLLVGLGFWFVAFPTVAVAGALIGRLGTSGALSRVAQLVLGGSVGAIVVFLSLMATVVVVIAPAHVAGEDVVMLGRVVGFAGTTMDWVITGVVLGLGPALAVLASGSSWAPLWLRRCSVGVICVAIAEWIALAAAHRDVAFVMVPVGLAYIVAAGLAALRHGER